MKGVQRDLAKSLRTGEAFMSTATSACDVDFTANNLLVAFEGEVNTRARYLAFAARADADGHHGIASLFRAAARAEQIHARNQARVLRQMGEEADIEAEPCIVHSTEYNLQSALAGETYEIEVLYPAFIEEATSRINSTAARSFTWALEAEKTHAVLFSEALQLLQDQAPDSRLYDAHDFFVCPVCACTSRNVPEENCDICCYPSARVETIR